MASSLEFMHFVAARLGGAGAITYRKMFGEYCVYCDGKLFGCVCDDRLLVKNTEPGRALMPDGRLEPPYEGGKPMLRIERLEDGDFLKALVRVTCEALPSPKKKAHNAS
uniref:TfoX/Sxy family protein n=1 Tax=uncultured Bilophila sp. TaxID=529385 RepID=UPI0025F97486|nr:TfoX/Sxy family protein [uncultured Bilophila sp.]